MQCLEHFHSLLFVGGRKDRNKEGRKERRLEGWKEGREGGRKEKGKEFMSDNLTRLVDSRRCNVHIY